MSRPALTWLLFALCALLGLGAMTWITRGMLRTEWAEREARQRIAQEERVHQALWRMDSTFALFLAPEGARPRTDFQAFHPTLPMFTPSGDEVDARELLAPSPLLFEDNALVLLRFEVDARGRFRSPLVPRPEWRALARRVCPDPRRLDRAEALLAECRAELTWNGLRQAMEQRGVYLLDLDQLRRFRIAASRSAPSGGGDRLAPPYPVFLGAWTPFWTGRRLVLARQVWDGEEELLQCTWLDWAEVREVLLSAARSLLPRADLTPVPSAGASPRPMASLPIELLPGRLEAPVEPLSRPIRMALLVGWSAALAAGLAGALLLHRAVRFGERRSAFVSAVTHELRTPLTTFRLYTDLLAMGMLPEEERASFLDTLRVEADRLDHLVKNVLSFARLEAVKRARLEPVALGELLDRPLPRLVQRAHLAGMTLDAVVPEGLKELPLRTDPSLVEQIVFNLVDNACKYAASAEDRTIRLEAAAGDRMVQVRVRDWGPGIPAPDRAHLFRPFHKSAERAARSGLGVGLGLALCRRLARSLGGDLRLDEVGGAGACFLLELPRAPRGYSGGTA